MKQSKPGSSLIALAVMTTTKNPSVSLTSLSMGWAGLRVCFVSSEPDESGQIFLTMPQKLHRQKGLTFLLVQLPSPRNSCCRGTS
jgi:hypothetical protein